jgi:hypothetical protein
VNKWDNDNDWFFDRFDKESKSMFRQVAGVGVLFFILNLLFWLAIIAAIVVGLVIVL